MNRGESGRCNWCSPTRYTASTSSGDGCGSSRPPPHITTGVMTYPERVA